ncbi:hypothetical protein GcC1_058041 [Golovinomyces cichoracearum]|uniref:Uncharacterized protein n=1 Tax=Golovinomyces cichoracearum TaxID=62708 RepID=A0A420IUG7_9PEZI|nr:hypothetical protein GcC1_058041 [Golovinomyces cichoracearum]
MNVGPTATLQPPMHYNTSVFSGRDLDEPPTKCAHEPTPSDDAVKSRVTGSLQSLSPTDKSPRRLAVLFDLATLSFHHAITQPPPPPGTIATTELHDRHDRFS